MSDIFLSYARPNRETARALAAALAQHGWTVWWDRYIPTGRTFDEVIESQLAAARCVIVLWSAASVASEWVKTEAADAKDRRLLVPVLIEPVRIPLEFRRVQAADLTGWKGEPAHAGLATLVGDLTGILGEPPAAAPAAGDEEGRRGAEPPAEEAPQTPKPSPVGRLDTTPTPPLPVVEPPPPEPVARGGEPPAGERRGQRPYLIAGAAALALIVLVFAIFQWGFGSAENMNVGNVRTPAPSSPTPRTSPPSTPPPGNGNGTTHVPPVNPDPERVRQIGLLVQQLNAGDERTRRAATGELKERFASDPHAVEQALGLLDEGRVGELSPQGLINVLFFLNNATDEAWTLDTFRKALGALRRLEQMELGTQAGSARAKFKLRLTQLVRIKRGQDDGAWAMSPDELDS
jgi:hypothetical protein